MTYVPEPHRSRAIPEGSIEQIESSPGPRIYRCLRLVDRRSDGTKLLLFMDGIAKPLCIARCRMMRFGPESISAEEYFRRVVEQHDLIDAITAPHQPHANGIDIDVYWVHIRYEDEESRTRADFRRKDDGHFCLRTKAGEKAERRVEATLVAAGHEFEGQRNAGCFVIRSKGKKARKPDRKCLSCGATFEMKKRNMDRNLRISHSALRCFDGENGTRGWHVFVFPDFATSYVLNEDISAAVREGRIWSGHDAYDAWADVDPGAVRVFGPPACEAATRTNRRS